MARRLFGPDLVFRPGGRPGNALRSVAELALPVYEDNGTEPPVGTTLADILTFPGAVPIPGSAVTVGADEMYPRFWGPDDDADSLIISVDGRHSRIYTRADASDVADALSAESGARVAGDAQSVATAAADATAKVATEQARASGVEATLGADIAAVASAGALAVGEVADDLDEGLALLDSLGTMRFAGEFDASRVYEQGEVVTYGGRPWVNLTLPGGMTAGWAPAPMSTTYGAATQLAAHPFAPAQGTAWGKTIGRMLLLHNARKLLVAYGDYSVDTGPVRITYLDVDNPGAGWTDLGVFRTEQTFVMRANADQSVVWIPALDPQGSTSATGDALAIVTVNPATQALTLTIENTILPWPYHLSDAFVEPGGDVLFTGSAPSGTNGSYAMVYRRTPAGVWSVDLQVESPAGVEGIARFASFIPDAAGNRVFVQEYDRAVDTSQPQNDFAYVRSLDDPPGEWTLIDSTVGASPLGTGGYGSRPMRPPGARADVIALATTVGGEEENPGISRPLLEIVETDGVLDTRPAFGRSTFAGLTVRDLCFAAPDDWASDVLFFVDGTGAIWATFDGVVRTKVGQGPATAASLAVDGAAAWPPVKAYVGTTDAKVYEVPLVAVSAWAPLADLSGPDGASAVGFTPSGNISATTVQAAVVEVAAESIPAAEKGALGGVASLNGSGRLTAPAVDLLAYASVATAVPLRGRGVAGQSGPLGQWEDSAGTAVARVRYDGLIAAPYFDGISGAGPFLSMSGSDIIVQARNSAHTPFTVRGIAGQTGPLQRWQDVTSTTFMGLTSAGVLQIGSGAYPPVANGRTLLQLAHPGASGSYVSMTTAATGQAGFWWQKTGVNEGNGWNVRYNAANAADPIEWYWAGVQRWQLTANGGETIFPAASVVGQTVRLAAAATGDGVRIEDSAAATLWAVTSAGIPKWAAAANAQTTVGLTGSAAALPALPAKYLKVQDSAGTTFVIPAYNA